MLVLQSAVLGVQISLTFTMSDICEIKTLRTYLRMMQRVQMHIFYFCVQFFL